jgi:rhodanese-related sulfurtransferase
MHHSPRFVALCEDARRRVAEISGDDLSRWMAGGAGPDGGSATAPILLDVREDHEWQVGRLPGARHLGRGILERDIERLIPDLDAPVVLYCGGGYRSALAADSIGRMGYRRVYSLAGGFRGWRDAGRPVDTDATDAHTDGKAGA